MTMDVIGDAAPSAKEDLAPHRDERRDPPPDDAVIKLATTPNLGRLRIPAAHHAS